MKYLDGETESRSGKGGKQNRGAAISDLQKIGAEEDDRKRKRAEMISGRKRCYHCASDPVKANHAWPSAPAVLERVMTDTVPASSLADVDLYFR